MNALSERDIYYCSIDDFCTGNIEELKRAVLISILEKYLPDFLYLNAKELAYHIYQEARIEASDKEIQNFYNRYIKTLRLKIADDGEVRLEIAR